MIGFESSLDAPAAVRYHPEAIEQIIQCVDEGVYCALLGPRLCGKTLLLRFIEQDISKLLGWTCAFIDLMDLRAATQPAFFADLIRLTGHSLRQITGIDIQVPAEPRASSVVFRAFLAEALNQIHRDIVLIIDPLEALPIDLVQALLTSLRAVYMDQQNMDHQVIAIVSGALSLATMTAGESSPFRGIARRVFVGDLSAQDSRDLILELLMEGETVATRQAIHKLQQATSGDIYLIRKISQCLVQLSEQRSSVRIRSRDVSFIIDRFLRQEVFHYAPLVEAIRMIEEDPDLLECVLRLLQTGRMLRSALPLPLSPDLDPLYLTGVVEQEEDGYYQIQNIIYHRFLEQHFSSGRVGHVLTMAGRWDSALDYLEAGIAQGNPQSHADLQAATINSMYASPDLGKAVHFLQRGLKASFGVNQANVWYHPPLEDYLLRIGSGESRQNENGWMEGQIPLTADRLETSAYRQQLTLRGQEGEDQVVRAVPLIVPGSKSIGVVTIHEDFVTGLFSDSRERDLQLGGFLHQAARALQTVGIRRQELALAGRVQASLLPTTPPVFPGWDFAAAWRPARETAGDFYDFIPLTSSRLGIVIGDVVDKGMGPALLMALTRTLVRTYAADFPDNPEYVVQIANERIFTDLRSGLFVTLFYGILNIRSGEIVYCNAGHNPPFLQTDSAAQPSEILTRTGMAIGITEGQSWERRSVTIPPGGTLFLYTDGVIDAQNSAGKFFGEQQLLDFCQSQNHHSASQLRNAVMNEIFSFAGSQTQVDDITLMIIKHLL